MDQKKIDELFQKQLKNLESAPNQRVWSHIETKLKKKKRRVFPFWLFSSAVASVLVLGFLIFPFSKDENTIEKTNTNEVITITPKMITPSESKIDATSLDNILKKEILITEKEAIVKKKKNSFITKNPKELPFPKKTVKILALNALNNDHNTFSLKQNTLLEITKSLNPKIVSKKIDINNFLKPKDSSTINKYNQERWAIAPVFAVLKSNSFSNTSPIDANLDNSTKGENSFSYGVQVAYKINKKWTIQSGIHLQEMSYSNNQIAVFSSSQGSSSTTKFTNEGFFSFDVNNTKNIDFNANSLTNAISYSGNLTQNYGYIEIPFELKYNFSSRKEFKTQLVAGFSSLFLNKNSILLGTESSSQEGKASNLNMINFSGNLGFDFNYHLNKNWSLQLNPMLKVQLNTFNENANNFAPFFTGIYTGVHYKF
tara:strand:+ start:7147 stop:8427 length:1281 start_codon:yes stop_codon:yes gene_type:complete